jgi:hypothetical protein
LQAAFRRKEKKISLGLIQRLEEMGVHLKIHVTICTDKESFILQSPFEPHENQLARQFLQE